MAQGKSFKIFNIRFPLYIFQSVPPISPTRSIHSFKKSMHSNKRMAHCPSMISLQYSIVLICISIFISTIFASSDPPLTLDYYKSACPTVFEIVKKEMECQVLSDPRNAAFIVRLHFHDCFVQVN